MFFIKRQIIYTVINKKAKTVLTFFVKVHMPLSSTIWKRALIETNHDILVHSQKNKEVTKHQLELCFPKQLMVIVTSILALQRNFVAVFYKLKWFVTNIQAMPSDKLNY